MYNKRGITLTHELRQFIWNYSWDGNVRELKNLIESMIALAKDGEKLTMSRIPTYMKGFDDKKVEETVNFVQEDSCREYTSEDGKIPYYELMDELEKNMICEALEKAKGNKSKAADILGLPRQTLKYRIERLGL